MDWFLYDNGLHHERVVVFTKELILRTFGILKIESSEYFP